MMGSYGIQWDPPARHNISMIALGLPAEIPADPNKIPVKSRLDILQCNARCWGARTGVEMGLSVRTVPTGTCEVFEH